MGKDFLRERLAALYSPDAYGDRATWLARALADYLHQAETANRAYSTPIDMKEFRAVADAALAQPEAFEKAANEFLDRTAWMHSPHCIGHQVAPPLPVASLFAAMASLTNQGNAIYQLSPFATAAERAVVRKLNTRIGWDEKSDGFLTNGGSMANLTAILAARNHATPTAWRGGASGNEVIFSGEGAHYSIARAAGILGIGTDNVVKIGVGNDGKMSPTALAMAVTDAKRAGKTPLCIVASACSTSLGLFDDLTAIAEVARREKIWFHVDGAHGASVLFSAQYRRLAKGIELADSVIWDAHKMMHVPALCAAVLFRDGERSFETFQQDAPYLFHGKDAEVAYISGGLRTLECTKQSLSLPLWGAWAVHGEQTFGDIIDLTFDLTREFAGMIDDQLDFLPVRAPESNIFCFRYVPDSMRHASPADLSHFQKRVWETVVARGNFYITLTSVDGVYALRVTLMNPLTETRHLQALLEEIRTVSLSHQA